MATAVLNDAVALTLQSGQFPGAQKCFLRRRLSNGVAGAGTLNVRCPRTQSGRWTDLRTGNRAQSTAGGRGDNFNHSVCEGYTGKRIGGEVVIDRERQLTIGSDGTAAALRHFLVGVKYEDVGAQVRVGCAWVNDTQSSIRSSFGICIREVVDVQCESRGAGRTILGQRKKYKSPCDLIPLH
jgi:hypothetical protein